MPQIDVSDVTLDPEIAGERFSVVRRAEVVNDFGESVVVSRTYPRVPGSVTPTAPNSLAREEAYQTQQKTIQVIARFRLRGVARDGAGAKFQPDLILWRGDAYLVTTVDDYSQYGAGFVRADCASTDYEDVAPGSPEITAPA